MHCNFVAFLQHTKKYYAKIKNYHASPVKITVRYDKTQNVEVLSPTIVFCVSLCLIFNSVDKKSGKIIFSFFTYSECDEKVQRIGWLTFRRNVRSSEPYQNISIFTVYIDIFCTGANELPVRTGILSLPDQGYRDPSSRLFCLMTDWLRFRVEYLITQSITSHACTGFVHAPSLSDIVT